MAPCVLLSAATVPGHPEHHRKGAYTVATAGQGQRKGLATVLAVVLIVVAAVVVATTGDSWAVRMTLTVVSIDVAVRLYRWGLTA